MACCRCTRTASSPIPLRGVHARVSVTWNFEAPAGAGDTHFSVMRGSQGELMIRQGAEQNIKPVLYVERLRKSTHCLSKQAAVRLPLQKTILVSSSAVRATAWRSPCRRNTMSATRRTLPR